MGERVVTDTADEPVGGAKEGLGTAVITLLGSGKSIKRMIYLHVALFMMSKL